ncbi:hypothetical protein Hdeb2414_s0012g00391761 [Helianthus debilis subsp. tardiflorus]
MWLFGWSEDRGWWVMVVAEVNGGDGGWSVVGRQGVPAMSVVPMVRSMSVLGVEKEGVCLGVVATGRTSCVVWVVATGRASCVVSVGAMVYTPCLF